MGVETTTNLLLVGSVDTPPVYLKMQLMLSYLLAKGAETLAPTLGGGGQCWQSVGSRVICMVGGLGWKELEGPGDMACV